MVLMVPLQVDNDDNDDQDDVTNEVRVHIL